MKGRVHSNPGLEADCCESKLKQTGLNHFKNADIVAGIVSMTGYLQVNHPCRGRTCYGSATVTIRVLAIIKL